MSKTARRRAVRERSRLGSTIPLTSVIIEKNRCSFIKQYSPSTPMRRQAKPAELLEEAVAITIYAKYTRYRHKLRFLI
jgi:hypothetical protein